MPRLPDRRADLTIRKFSREFEVGAERLVTDRGARRLWRVVLALERKANGPGDRSIVANRGVACGLPMRLGL